MSSRREVTVPVGTARRIAGELSWACPRAELAWNPEFLREGSAVADTLSPDRIVAGATSGDAEKILRQVYARLLSSGTPLIVTSLETAELAKVAANAFLATKISFINAMAEVCETAGGDVRALAKILGADPRIGSASLHAGLGYGEAAACRRTSARSWPAPRNWAQGPRSLSCGRWTPSTCGAAPAPLTSPSGWLAATWPEYRCVCWVPPSSRARMTCVTLRPGRGADPDRHGGGQTLYDPAALANARRSCPELAYARTPAEAARDAHVVLLLTDGQSSLRSRRKAWMQLWPGATLSMPATSSTRAYGVRLDGITRLSG